MIVQRQRTGRLAIRQQDHAAFSAFILRHWSAHSFLNHPNREQILTATAEHESGWAKLDASPRLDPKTCLPVDHLKINPEEARAVWTRAARPFVKEEPFIALLIIHHAYSVHEAINRRDSKWKAFFVEFARWRAKIRDELGLTHNDIEHPYSFMRMANWFALEFCTDPKLGTERPERYAGYAVRRQGTTYQFRPWPFSVRTLSYELPVIDLPPKGFTSDREVRAAIRKPRLETVTFGSLEVWD